jgi:3-oxoacyl-[acyl-carrier-protein] synthase III
MRFASITGWGSAMPPAVLTNADLSTFLETSDEWITTRTGMKERRISHVSAVEMSTVAATRALACAGLDARDVDLIVYGSCSYEEQVPNAADDVNLMVPHQANLRIIEAVAKYAGMPMEKVMLTVQKYGNMSAATVPVALVEALEAGRVKPGSLLLMPGFGGGLTWASLLVRWGDRVTPLGASSRELPPSTKSALEMVNEIRATQDPHGRSAAGLAQPV